MSSAQAMNMNHFLLLLLYHRGSTLNWSHYSMCEQIYPIWFANSTWFVDESRVPTKPRHPAHDLSRALWLARTQTPRIVRLHRWMLPDRTAILIPFDSTCSSDCNFIFMHKMHINIKNVLNIANDTWNAPENQTRGIIVIAYHGNFYEAKRWSHRPQEFELTRLLLENHDPSCEMLRFGRSGHQNLCQTLPIFFHGVVRARHRHTSILMMSELHLNFL